jgi:ABC-type transporter Mla subunit MlaD
LHRNTTFSTELVTMSENVLIPTDDEPKSFAIVKIMSDRARGLEALAAASADNLDPATLRTGYNNAIQLARALNASENLTERFATLLSDIETLTNEWDAATADLNTATTQLTQLRTQLTQTLALATAAATNGGGQMGSRKGQTDPETFTGEDWHKLRSFITLLTL